ncbi:MAG: family 20 glycosylhydrolase [Lentisphaeria bacterium]|nr:family 20 glycosylhydrolase [Lentisphaeria bacterium]MBR7144085.1 family 20 glycosylhydrolase [Lentisphaeria bacterium]
MQDYQIRAAQIDLNRQKETMEFIRFYIDFLAENGYNTLLLYIAWRVKLKSHPYPDEKDAYTADELREIVDYAFKRGLKVIPTTNLTFVNSLTRYPEMAELLEDGTRFWGAKRGNFCVSNPKVYEFIDAYLTELAELVPGEYLHIGGDECWDLAYCEKCTAGGMTFDKESCMYKDFILKCREIVVGKLKRRMIMWDDMFDFYPHILPEMPRDIIFAHWQYQSDVYQSVAHFGNRQRKNMLEIYDKLGFQFLIAPATYLTSNGRSFSEYALPRKNLLGGIMTTWCNHLRFMYKALPVIASVGRYWAGQGAEEACFNEFIKEYFNSSDPALIQAVRCFCENNSTRFTRFTALNTSNFAFSGLNYGADSRRQLELAVLQEKLPQITNETGKRIADELILMLELECAIFDLEKLVRGIVYKSTTPRQISDALALVQSKGDNYAARWELWRPGIAPNTIASYINNFVEKTQLHCEKLFRGNYLKILFASANQFGAELLNIYLLKDDQKIPVVSGSFRNVNGGAHYDQFLPLDEAVAADTLVIEAKGYGGQGVAYAELCLGDQRFVPVSASGEGMVSDPDFVLDDDCKYSFLGSQDTMYSWKDRAAADAVHTLTIKLRPAAEV